MASPQTSCRKVLASAVCRSRIAPGCRLNRRATWCKASPRRVSASCTTFLISGYVRLLNVVALSSCCSHAFAQAHFMAWARGSLDRHRKTAPYLPARSAHIGGHARGAAAPLHTVADLACLQQRQAFRVVSRCRAPARPGCGPEGLWAGFRGVSHTCWRSVRGGTGSSSGGEASDRAAALRRGLWRLSGLHLWSHAWLEVVSRLVLFTLSRLASAVLLHLAARQRSKQGCNLHRSSRCRSSLQNAANNNYDCVFCDAAHMKAQTAERVLLQ